MPIPDPKKPLKKAVAKAPAKPPVKKKPPVPAKAKVSVKGRHVPPKPREHAHGVDIALYGLESKLHDEEIEALKLALRAWYHDVDAKDKGGLGSGPDITPSTPTAMSAPTTITEEIALVTAMSGVCRAGVTLHTT